MAVANLEKQSQEETAQPVPAGDLPSGSRRTDSTEPPSLAARAIEFLHIAANAEPDETGSATEGRGIWQPDSWLMQRSWQELADQGAGDEAMAVAAMQEMRNPLATVQALYRLSSGAQDAIPTQVLVAHELHMLHTKLFGAWVVSDDVRQAERLSLAAASAVQIDDHSLAFACLERLDQIHRGWDLVVLRAELRNLLAETISAVGLHPLTSYLITTAIRRHEEAGAQFLYQIVSNLAPQAHSGELSRKSARLLRKCVETFQYAMLSSLNSRRLAAIAFGQAGMIADVLAQVTTMANVQEARRETGMTSMSGDPHFLRQVTRPNAKPDVDFQVYTLQQAIAAMPVRQLSREDRVRLANRVAELAVQSDGWTAAGATTTLVSLGALKYAVDVVDFISPTDPTRSEGVISLVRALLDVGEADQAREQVNKALAWLKEYTARNPERATIWGVADVYLDHGRPDMALYLLEQRHEEPPSFMERLRRMMRSGWTDDALRDNRIRLRALLAQEGAWTPELQELYSQLLRWAPNLLDGEALISFYLDGMLTPLLEAGRTEQALAMLPQLVEALGHSTGDKHSVHVRKAAQLLAAMLVAAEAEQAERLAATEEPPGEEAESQAEIEAIEAHAGKTPAPSPAQTAEALQAFLVSLWTDDAHRGLWQTIHGVEGSLPLLFSLEGPEALVAVAEMAANDGGLWLQ